MPIQPLQLPPVSPTGGVPRVDFSPLADIGLRIGQSRREEAERAREAEAFGGLVDATAAPAGAGIQPNGQPQLPLGLRNNNPGNLEDGPLARSLPGYKGPDPSGRYATFDTPENGLGAMDALLTAYGRRGIKTALQITERWAPKNPKDPNNDPVAYARYIGGGDPNRPVDLANADQRKQIAQAMARWENGLTGGPRLGAGVGAPGMPPELAGKVQALFAAGTPATRAAGLELLKRYLPSAKDLEPFTLSEGQVRYGPSGEVIARGPPKQQRKHPNEDRVSPTQLKMLEQAEDENTNLRTTVESLTRASEINGQIFTGTGAGLRTYLGTKLWDNVVPDFIADPKTAQLTEEWTKLMAPEAIKDMASTLKGATTDFELRKFTELLADPSTTAETRAKVLERMITLARRKARDNELRMDQIRGGGYAKPGGGQSGARQSAPGAGQSAPTFKPPADWQYSASRKQYRDPAGNLYDENGTPVKP